jgi:eukaryotic-like serine/threonine-protein kinase
MALKPKQLLDKGKYTIDRELSRGRFGITYLAQRNDDGTWWVIKILDQTALTTLTSEERKRRETKFWQEAISLARCNGTPHIVKVATPFKEGSMTCLPMEYLSEKSLADRPETVLMEQTALEYMRQLGEALSVVHREKLVHCDIRPANIFYRNGNKDEVVLADFGLALDTGSELTRTRKLETSVFSPPELCGSSRKIGSYTDVYSLSATLYQMLTGEAPESAEQRGLQQQMLTPPKARNSQISDKTANGIMLGLELDPEKRPQTVKDWLKQLGLQQVASKQETNWAKWAVIAAVVIPGLGLIIAILAMIPSWLPVLRPEGQTQPPVKPAVQVSPK